MPQKPQNWETNVRDAVATTSSAFSPPREKARSQPLSRLIEPLDICTLLSLVVLTPAAWILPHRLWVKFGRNITGLIMRLLPWTGGKLAMSIDAYLGQDPLRPTTREILIRALSRYLEDTLLLLRLYRPDGWEPVVDLRGLEHLQAAFANGKGVVLWLSHFMHASLVTKIAMYRAGFASCHLSHPRHGFTSTRFGMRFLNPIRIHMENRYLKERVTMNMDNATAAVQTLKKRLLAGAIISISARELTRKPVNVPFLAGTLPLAIGAPSLAQQTGAVLLPVHALQLSSGEFTVIIEQPIELDASQPRSITGETAARKYAIQLETVVREFPDQWLGWRYLSKEATSDRDKYQASSE